MEAGEVYEIYLHDNSYGQRKIWISEELDGTFITKYEFSTEKEHRVGVCKIPILIEPAIIVHGMKNTLTFSDKYEPFVVKFFEIQEMIPASHTPTEKIQVTHALFYGEVTQQQQTTTSSRIRVTVL